MLLPPLPQRLLVPTRRLWDREREIDWIRGGAEQRQDVGEAIRHTGDQKDVQDSVSLQFSSSVRRHVPRRLRVVIRMVPRWYWLLKPVSAKRYRARRASRTKRRSAVRIV